MEQDLPIDEITDEERAELEFEQLCDYYGYPRWKKPMPHECYNPYIGLD